MTLPPSSVLAAWHQAAVLERIESLGAAGGFSGARFWRIRAGDYLWCLRRWPREHPSSERLRWIHRILQGIDETGVTFIPVPCETRRGETFVEAGGHLWEFTPWLRGEADYARAPTSVKLEAAMQSLARFHRAAASVQTPTSPCPAPAADERFVRLQEFRGKMGGCLHAATEREPLEEWRRRAREILLHFQQLAPPVERELAQARHLAAAIQPVIADIWRDNVLFEGDRVSGFVDFGAMRIDSVAVDIARLLGSLTGDQEERWTLGLQAYQSARPLSDNERRLVTIFDAAAVLLSGMNWLRWLYVENRRFEQPAAVLQRLDEILIRLRYRSAGAVRQTSGGLLLLGQ